MTAHNAPDAPGSSEQLLAESVRNFWIWLRRLGQPNRGCGQGGCAHPCAHPLRGLCYVKAERAMRQAEVQRLRKEVLARKQSWVDACNRRLPTAELRFREYLKARESLALIDGAACDDGSHTTS